MWINDLALSLRPRAYELHEALSPSPPVHLVLVSDEAAHRDKYPNCRKRLPRRAITLGNDYRKSHVVVKHRNLIP